jgi:hypothetical protein
MCTAAVRGEKPSAATALSQSGIAPESPDAHDGRRPTRAIPAKNRFRTGVVHRRRHRRSAGVSSVARTGRGRLCRSPLSRDGSCLPGAEDRGTLRPDVHKTSVYPCSGLRSRVVTLPPSWVFRLQR